jgi:hypothetical protein
VAAERLRSCRLRRNRRRTPPTEEEEDGGHHAMQSSPAPTAGTGRRSGRRRSSWAPRRGAGRTVAAATARRRRQRRSGVDGSERESARRKGKNGRGGPGGRDEAGALSPLPPAAARWRAADGSGELGQGEIDTRREQVEERERDGPAGLRPDASLVSVYFLFSLFFN